MTTPPSPDRTGNRLMSLPPMAHRLAALAAAGALLVGCSSGSDDAADRPTTTTTRADEAASLPPGAEDLAGRWAHYDVVAYQDDTMKTLIISTGFADLEVRGQVHDVVASGARLTAHRPPQPALTGVGQEREDLLTRRAGIAGARAGTAAPRGSRAVTLALVDIALFDLFPQTHHVETVVRLTAS